ncbi:hypothetical protein DL238_01465 [Alteriqipengyuania lutimaris]|uniref:Uncharacterized protein n=2 Tax=Alteriqipengyuania lutimaris TaxID=1538146 RepID=A0A395LHK4_9SPHN|nr:hypothetical protein DL238_01465 [Alteriqipengyuania lutimaris]
MNTLPSTEGENGGMRAVVEYSGFQPQRTEEIPEEHKPYLDKVLGMHPFDDVPGNVSGGTNLPNQKPVSIEALSPEMRREVSDRLAHHRPEDHDRFEAQYVAEAIKAKRGKIRAMTGVGKEALPFHREQAEIAGRYYELQRRRDALQDDLDRVREYTTETDPETGAAKPAEIMAITGTRRAAYEDQVIELDRQMRLLVGPDGSYGIEAQKRLEETLRKSAAILYDRAQVQQEEAEAKRRAAEAEREERINRRVDSLKTMRTGKR